LGESIPREDAPELGVPARKLKKRYANDREWESRYLCHLPFTKNRSNYRTSAAKDHVNNKAAYQAENLAAWRILRNELNKLHK